MQVTTKRGNEHGLKNILLNVGNVADLRVLDYANAQFEKESSLLPET